MDCRKFATLLDDHRGESLTPSERDEATMHIVTCEACRTAWSVVQELRPLRVHAISHPRADLLNESVQLAASVGGTESRRRMTARKIAVVGTVLAATVLIALVLI